MIGSKFDRFAQSRPVAEQHGIILFQTATPVPLSRPNSAPDEFLKFR
jgi:hypothetical protein